MRKITAIRKNRRENGRRADPLGSNPHSKGEFFSRSEIVFLAKIVETNITAMARKRMIIIIIDENRIIFLGKTKPTDWKSIALFILEKYNIIYPLTNRLKCKGKVKLHLQNVSTRRQLQIQSDGKPRSGSYRGDINILLKMLYR